MNASYIKFKNKIKNDQRQTDSSSTCQAELCSQRHADRALNNSAQQRRAGRSLIMWSIDVPNASVKLRWNLHTVMCVRSILLSTCSVDTKLFGRRVGLDKESDKTNVAEFGTTGVEKATLSRHLQSLVFVFNWGVLIYPWTCWICSCAVNSQNASNFGLSERNWRRSAESMEHVKRGILLDDLKLRFLVSEVRSRRSWRDVVNSVLRDGFSYDGYWIGFFWNRIGNWIENWKDSTFNDALEECV